jgi:hypothetical protein
MIRDWCHIFLNSRIAENPKSKTNVIMLRSLKSFADLSLKVVAVRTADDGDFEFEFPASGPQSTPSALTTPTEHHVVRRRDPLAEYPGWYHGGIND